MINWTKYMQTLRDQGFRFPIARDGSVDATLLTPIVLMKIAEELARISDVLRPRKIQEGKGTVNG